MTEETKRLEYEVVKPYQCPNSRHWHAKGGVVKLLPCEAQQLLLQSKIKAVTAPQQKESADA